VKKAAIVVLATALVMSIAASSLGSVLAALAEGTYTDHQNASGTVTIDIEGLPVIVIDGWHYDSGSLGSGDVIRIWRYFTFPTGSRFIPVAILTDIPGRTDLFEILYAAYPTSIQLINDPSAINIVREGKSKNIHIVWKRDLVVPDELWGPQHNIFVPGFTIPHGMLVIRGHGEIVSGSSTSGDATFSQTVSGWGYDGDATFVCSTWEFGGPVGVNEGMYRTAIRLDVTVITTVY